MAYSSQTPNTQREAVKLGSARDCSRHPPHTNASRNSNPFWFWSQAPYPTRQMSGGGGGQRGLARDQAKYEKDLLNNALGVVGGQALSLSFTHT